MRIQNCINEGPRPMGPKSYIGFNGKTPINCFVRNYLANLNESLL
jgi:hypothetical protein